MSKNKKNVKRKPPNLTVGAAYTQNRKNRYYRILSFILIVLTGIIAYRNSFNCGFHFDDVFNIVENGAIRRLSDINSWWNYVPSRPFGTFTFVLNYHFNQLDVWGYHLVNLIIHISNALLVWWMLLLIFSSPAMLTQPIAKHKKIIALAAALLFISHPIETQAVTYIVQRLASLVTMFYLFTICFYLKARITESSKKQMFVFYGVAAVSAVLAILTKENSFTLPLSILLVELFFIRAKSIRINFKDAKIWVFAALFLIIIVFIFLNFSFSVFNPIKPEQGHTYSLTAGTYLLTQFRVITTYLRLLVLPIHQNLDYDYPISASFFELKTALSFLFLCVIFVAGILAGKKFSLISFGIFWFFITISIESSFIPIPNVIFEHRLYMPSIGFFVIISSLPFYFLKEKFVRMVSVALLTLAGVYVVLTIMRNKVWKDEFSLWTNVLEHSPNKPRPLNNMGNALLDTGKANKAMEYFNRAIANNPFYEIAYYNRGNTKFALENYFGAIGDYSQAIALWKTFPDPYFKRAMAKKKLHDYNGALDDMNEALRIMPDFTLVWSERGLLKKEMGDTAGALADLSKAIDLYPEFPDPYNHRGTLKRDQGNFQAALDDYSKAIKLFPQNADAFNNRGYVKAMMGDLTNALTDFDNAIRLNPKFVEAYNNRANTRAGLKDFNGSIQDFTKALELNPANSLAMCNRGISKYSLNDKKGACADWVAAANMGNGQAIMLVNQYCLPSGN
ncbi:MAG: tetratricopeptide repeat protein [Bacteroidota bacterium]